MKCRIPVRSNSNTFGQLAPLASLVRGLFPNRTSLSPASARNRSNRRRRDPLQIETLEGRDLLSGSGWQNPVLAYDVNDDGFVSPIDVLIGYNALNANGPQPLPVPATPPPFYDVNGDGDHTPTDLVQGVNYLNLFGSGPDTGMPGGSPYTGVVEVRLEATDLSGNPITSTVVGDSFLLRAYVKDTGVSPRGVFAAYTDVTYDAALATVNGSITPAPQYTNVTSGTNGTLGLTDEAGGVSGSIAPLGGGEFLLFEMPLVANAVGQVTFASGPASGLGHEVLVYGSDSSVPSGQIDYGSTTLDIMSRGAELVANNDTFRFDEDSVGNALDVLANDTSTPGDVITITAVGASSAGGTVTISANQQRLIYTPAANFFGLDSFQYTIGSGSLTSSATVLVEVYPTNDPPTAVDDQFAVDADTASNLLSVLDNDTIAPDENETLRIVSVGMPDQSGSVAIAPSGQQLLYTPASSFTGTETFVYYAADGNGGMAAATVTVTVTPRVNFVDANNNGSFDAGIDVPLIRGELEDGSFSTTKTEGGYTTVIAGAGLVIEVGVTGAKDLNFRAEGDLVVNATLNAGRDVQLVGRELAVHGAVGAGRDIALKADGPITAVGAALHAGRDVSVKTNGDVDPAPIVLDAATVSAGRNLEIVAKRGSVSMVGATATAGNKAEIKARDQIFADWATVIAGVEIDLIADEILGTPHLNAPKIRITTA